VPRCYCASFGFGQGCGAGRLNGMDTNRVELPKSSLQTRVGRAKDFTTAKIDTGVQCRVSALVLAVSSPKNSGYFGRVFFWPETHQQLTSGSRMMHGKVCRFGLSTVSLSKSKFGAWCCFRVRVGQDFPFSPPRWLAQPRACCQSGPNARRG